MLFSVFECVIMKSAGAYISHKISFVHNEDSDQLVQSD